MNADIKILKDKPAIAIEVTNDLVNNLNSKTGSYNLALSGGSTPRTIYEKWATIQNDSLWSKVHFFWGDERCVPPDHEDSNYKMAYDSFLSKIKIAENQIHRIHGEANPEVESLRYGNEIKEHLSIINNFPQFDWILLGMGTDGHTASLFPNSVALEEKNSICVIAQHPQSGQNRISLTLSVINNARKITFLVTGGKKAEIVRKILSSKGRTINHPAAQISPQSGILQWYLDEAAARLL
jgi:6-phosphogluconolactonase